MFEYEDNIYANFIFEQYNYAEIMEEILHQGQFNTDYHKKYVQDFVTRSYDKLSYSWTKINLIYQTQWNKNLNLINIFQRAFDSNFEIAFLIIKNIPIQIKKKKSRPLIIFTLSNNMYNPLKEYDVFLPVEVIDRALQNKTNLKTLIDFFDLSIMKLFNDKFGIEDNFEFPELG